MKKAIAIIILMFLSIFLLTACWDNRDIEELHIITGIALDINKDNDKMIDLTLQVANIQSGGGGGSNQSDTDQKPIIITSSAYTLSNALQNLNRESNKLIFLHHLEVILFSLELAEKGIYDYIDFFLRDTQARLEIPIILVEGRADEILKADLQEDKHSSIFLADFFERLKTMSIELHVRLIDVASKLVNNHYSPFIPVVKIEKEEEEEKIKDSGFAMILQGKSIGIFDVEDVIGLILVKDSIIGVDQEIIDGENIVVLKIINSTPKTSIVIKDNKITAEVNINITASIGEFMGFDELEPLQLIEVFQQLLEENTKQQIQKTFRIAKDNKCDFFGIGELIYKSNPRYWARIKDKWGEVFQTVEIKPNVNVEVRSTGQTTLTLEMEKKNNENR